MVCCAGKRGGAILQGRVDIYIWTETPDLRPHFPFDLGSIQSEGR